MQGIKLAKKRKIFSLSKQLSRLSRSNKARKGAVLASISWLVAVIMRADQTRLMERWGVSF
jgi:hypothetical protein